ncbi:uncharacterized protein LOC111264245 [Varroa jacobsoni]|nr:uncharacterized protein LOC111264245 [Varroa jacobsoni]
MATPTTSEEELSFWMKPGGKGGPVCGGANGVDASKTEEKTPPSRATVTRLVLVGLSVPLGLIALSIAVAMYLPPVHKVLARKSFYLQYYGIYGAILATLVFSLGATFPRVQASAQLLSIFGSLFIIAFAYFCAVLSVIVESAAGFILAMVQFIGCWELLVLSLIGMELEENIPGKIATCVAYIVNHAVIVALRPPSQMPVSDAILAGVVMLAIAWFFIAHVCKVVDKIQDDSQN